MGGPGSGRRPDAYRRGGSYAAEDDNPAGVSRVELEPWMARCVRVGTPDSLAQAANIRAELAGRTWQWVNPYA